MMPLKLLSWVLFGLCFFLCTLWNQFNLEERRNIATKEAFEFWESMPSCLITYSFLHIHCVLSLFLCVCVALTFSLIPTSTNLLFLCIPFSLFFPLPTKSQCPTLSYFSIINNFKAIFMAKFGSSSFPFIYP